MCMDYTAELADISVGSVGSEEGWSTVFVRTEKGEEVVESAVEKGYVEVKEIEDKQILNSFFVTFPCFFPVFFRCLFWVIIKLFNPSV